MVKETFTFHLVRPTCKMPLERQDTPNGKKWMNFDAGVILTDEEVRQM